MNRIYVSMMDGMTEPVWFNNVVPYMEMLMEKLNYDGEEISILFCNDEMIHMLNNKYRHIDSATDVLSFENGEEYTDEEGSWCNMGDIVLSLDTLPVNVRYFETDENTEMKRLLLHGLLHLNGMDHGEEHIEKNVQPEGEMLVLQEKMLSEILEYKLIS